MPSQFFKIRPNRSRCFRLLLTLIVPIVVELSSASAGSLRLQIESSESRFAFPDSGSLAAPNAVLDPNGLAGSSNFSALFQDSSQSKRTNGLAASFGSLTSNDIRLSGYQQSVIASAPGSTVTVNLQNFALSGHSTLTLLGDATATFIINVTKQFSLAQSAKVVLSGGIQWNHVFFNVLGTGTPVTLSGGTSLAGTLMATQRITKLRDHAIVYGNVFAQSVVIRQAAQIITPPVVSQ